MKSPDWTVVDARGDEGMMPHFRTRAEAERLAKRLGNGHRAAPVSDDAPRASRIVGRRVTWDAWPPVNTDGRVGARERA